MNDKELENLRARLDRADRIKSSIKCLEELLETNFSVRPFAPEHGNYGVHVQRSFGDYDLEKEISEFARKAAESRITELKRELQSL